MRVSAVFCAPLCIALALSAFPAVAGMKYVAVVETEVDAASGASAEMTSAEVRLLTTELRREAVKNLPRGQYSVMTTETVYAQGTATLLECAEENCVIALGSKIGADYIVRGTISKFQTLFTLSVEIYDTEDGNLVASSDPVRSENIRGLLENAAPVCAAMYRAFADTQVTAAVTPAAPEPALEPAAPPLPPATYAVAANAAPPKGGYVSRNPNLPNYAPGARVNIMATPAKGYAFTGWSGAGLPDDAAGGPQNPLTLTVIGDLALTANFNKLPKPPKPPKPQPAPKAVTAAPGAPKNKNAFYAGLALDAASVGALAIGILQNGNVKSYTDDGKYDNRAEYGDAKDAESKRNKAYIIGGALLLAGASVHILF
jgi:hypothetical protein